MTSASLDLRASIRAIQEKYGARNKDGSFAGGISIAKIYAEGGMKVSGRLSVIGGEPQTLPEPVPEDRKKLSSILTLTDLNQRRFASGNDTALSESDFEILKRRTVEDFSTYMSDPEMNVRRNRYLLDMAEYIKPGLSE